MWACRHDLPATGTAVASVATLCAQDSGLIRAGLLAGSVTGETLRNQQQGLRDGGGAWGGH